SRETRSRPQIPFSYRFNRLSRPRAGFALVARHAFDSRIVQTFRDKCFLGCEVVVEQPVGELRGFHDFGQAHTADPALSEQPGRPLQNPLVTAALPLVASHMAWPDMRTAWPNGDINSALPSEMTCPLLLRATHCCADFLRSTGASGPRAYLLVGKRSSVP